MEQVPKGALALAGIAVLLLLIGWFFVYFVIFIPRGSVG
jgi:Cytochrome c oxidase subunit IIa family